MTAPSLRARAYGSLPCGSNRSGAAQPRASSMGCPTPVSSILVGLSTTCPSASTPATKGRAGSSGTRLPGEEDRWETHAHLWNCGCEDSLCGASRYRTSIDRRTRAPISGTRTMPHGRRGDPLPAGVDPDQLAPNDPGGVDTRVSPCGAIFCSRCRAGGACEAQPRDESRAAGAAAAWRADTPPRLTQGTRRPPCRDLPPVRSRSARECSRSST
jgi:hypothetical protein